MRFLLICLIVLTLGACGGAPTQTTTAQEVIDRFKTAGLEAESTIKMQPNDYGLAPLLCQDQATRFLIPSMGMGKGGRLFVCSNADDATKLKTFYDKAGESSALFHSWVYQKGGTLVQINGELDAAKAAKYGEVIAALP